MLNLKIDDAAKYVALVSASLYAAGFLIVNSNLAKYGDLDPAFASSRYIFAGFLFVWYLVFVFWIVLKYMHDLNKVGAKMLELKAHNRLRFYIVTFQVGYLETFVRISVAALFFCSSTMPAVQLNAINNSPVMLLGGLALFLSHFGNFKTFWGYQLSQTPFLIAGFILFVIFADWQIKQVAVMYFFIVAIFVLVYEPMLKTVKDFDAKSTLAYFAITSLYIVISFGDVVFGNVKHEFGGGLPVKVTVYTKSVAGTAELAKAPSGGFSVDMIALNDKKLIGISGGKLAIINADGIASVVYPEK